MSFRLSHLVISRFSRSFAVGNQLTGRVLCQFSGEINTCAPSYRTLPSVRWYADTPASLPKKRTPGSGKGPITWKSLGITLGVGAVITACMLYFKREKQLKIEKDRTKALGKAALGGEWDLVDHTGVPRKSSDYHGKWTLLYFGFTHCPDVCPDELEKMCLAVDKIDGDKSIPNLIPLFITVDPDRDDVKAIANYVHEFSSKLVGLTGTHQQVERAARAYRVYFSQGPKDSDNDYIMDHTIIMYLVDPDGNFVDYYGQNKTADDVYNGVRMHMLKYDMIHK